VQPAHAILDFLGDSVKDAAEAAAVTGAVTDLIEEIDPNSAPVEENKKVQAENERLQKEVGEAKYLDRESRELLKGPDLTSKRLTTNIKATTTFIQRTKKLLSKIGLISPDVTTAVNTAETNSQLNEMQHNQQTLILLQQQQINDQKKKELQERKSWEDFIASERALRNSGK
jgi:hypothetical protein